MSQQDFDEREASRCARKSAVIAAYITLFALSAILAMQPTSQTAPAVSPPEPIGPLPSVRQLAWKDLEFTGFIHFGPNTFTGVEWGHGRNCEPLGVPQIFRATVH